MKTMNTMKQNTYKRLKYFVVAILILSGACNEFLDLEPENDLIRQEYWNTKEDVISVMAATYSAFRSTAEKSLILGEVRADLVTVGGSSFSNYERIAQSDITSTNNAVSWAGYYKAINLANTVMYFIPIVRDKDDSFDDDLRNTITSEMLFIRSLSYFYLVRLWKEVPLITQASVSDTIDIYVEKSPEKEVINAIIRDLKKASGLAVTGEEFDNLAHIKGRANKYSIQALLADVLLWDERYEEAVIYCDSIINARSNGGKLFDLEPNATWFNLYYPGNSPVESIFEIQYDDNLESQENPIYWDLLNNMQLQETKAGDLWEEDDTDIRLCDGNGPIHKYLGLSATSNTMRSDNARDANFIYYRYADILLIKAEALAQTNIQEANQLVRRIAERAGKPHITKLSYDAFMTALMDERAREFVMEGKRWFDLLRWAKKDGFENKQILINVILTKAANAQERAVLRAKVTDTMSYYLPIFEDELLSNINLTQNPYYDR